MARELRLYPLEGSGVSFYILSMKRDKELFNQIMKLPQEIIQVDSVSYFGWTSIERNHNGAPNHTVLAGDLSELIELESVKESHTNTACLSFIKALPKNYKVALIWRE